jgi:hypothetical protein
LLSAFGTDIGQAQAAMAQMKAELSSQRDRCSELAIKLGVTKDALHSTTLERDRQLARGVQLAAELENQTNRIRPLLEGSSGAVKASRIQHG